MIVELLFAESRVRLRWDSPYLESAINPFDLFHTCSTLHNDKLLKQIAWKNVTLKVAPDAISSLTLGAPFFMPLEEAAWVRTVVLNSSVLSKEERDNLASYFPSLAKFILLLGALCPVFWGPSDSKLKAAFRASVAAKTGIQVCPPELTYWHIRRRDGFFTIGELWGLDHFSARGFIAVVDFFPCSSTQTWQCGCRVPMRPHQALRNQNVAHKHHWAQFHLSLIFVHPSHENSRYGRAQCLLPASDFS